MTLFGIGEIQKIKINHQIGLELFKSVVVSSPSENLFYASTVILPIIQYITLGTYSSRRTKVINLYWVNGVCQIESTPGPGIFTKMVGGWSEGVYNVSAHLNFAMGLTLLHDFKGGGG